MSSSISVNAPVLPNQQISMVPVVVIPAAAPAAAPPNPQPDVPRLEETESLTPHQLLTLAGFDPEYPPAPFEYVLTSKFLLEKLRCSDFQLVPGAGRLLKLVETANDKQIQYYCLPWWKRTGEMFWLIVGIIMVGGAVTVSICSWGTLAPAAVALLKPALATAFALAGGAVLREVHIKWHNPTYRHSRFLKILGSKFVAGFLAGTAGGLIAPSLPVLTSLLGVPEVAVETLTEATLTSLATTLSEYVIKKWPGFKAFAKEFALTTLGCCLVFGILNLCPAHAATHHGTGANASATPQLNQEWTDVATEILAQQRGFNVTADAVWHLMQFTGEKCAHLFAKAQISHKVKLYDMIKNSVAHPHNIRLEILNKGHYFLNGHAVCAPTDRWRALAAFMTAQPDHTFTDIERRRLGSNLINHYVFDADKPLTMGFSQNRLEDWSMLIYFQALRFYGRRPVKKFRQLSDGTTSWPVFEYDRSRYYVQAFRVKMSPELVQSNVILRFCFTGLTATERCMRIEYEVGDRTTGVIDVTSMSRKSIRNLRHKDNSAVGVSIIDDSIVETPSPVEDNSVEIDEQGEEQVMV